MEQGTQSRYTWTTQRDGMGKEVGGGFGMGKEVGGGFGMGKEVGGGFGMGDTCTLMADS